MGGRRMKPRMGIPFKIKVLVILSRILPEKIVLRYIIPRILAYALVEALKRTRKALGEKRFKMSLYT